MQLMSASYPPPTRTAAVWYPEFRPSISGVPQNYIIRKCQGVVEFNASHIAANPGWAGGVGEETDMYLYVTSQPVGCDGAVAWASFCLLDVDTNQPRIGVANFCPNQARRAPAGCSSAPMVACHATSSYADTCSV